MSISDSTQPRTTGSTDLGASAGNGVYYVNEPSRSPGSEEPLAQGWGTHMHLLLAWGTFTPSVRDSC